MVSQRSQPADSQADVDRRWSDYLASLSREVEAIDAYARQAVPSWQHYFGQVDALEASQLDPDLQQQLSPEVYTRLARDTEKFESRWAITRWLLLLFTDVQYKLSLYYYLRFKEALDAVKEADRQLEPRGKVLEGLVQTMNQAVTRLPWRSRLRGLLLRFWQTLQMKTAVVSRDNGIEDRTGLAAGLARPSAASLVVSREATEEVEATLEAEELADLERRCGIGVERSLQSGVDRYVPRIVPLAADDVKEACSTRELAEKMAHEQIFLSIVYHDIGVLEDIFYLGAMKCKQAPVAKWDSIRQATLQEAKKKYHRILLYVAPDKHAAAYRHIRRAMQEQCSQLPEDMFDRTATGGIDVSIFGTYEGGIDERDILYNARHKAIMLLTECYQQQVSEFNERVDRQDAQQMDGYARGVRAIHATHAKGKPMFEAGFLRALKHLKHLRFYERVSAQQAQEEEQQEQILALLEARAAQQAQEEELLERKAQQQERILAQQQEMQALGAEMTDSLAAHSARFEAELAELKAKVLSLQQALPPQGSLDDDDVADTSAAAAAGVVTGGRVSPAVLWATGVPAASTPPLSDDHDDDTIRLRHTED